MIPFVYIETSEDFDKHKNSIVEETGVYFNAVVFVGELQLIYNRGVAYGTTQEVLDKLNASSHVVLDTDNDIISITNGSETKSIAVATKDEVEELSTVLASGDATLSDRIDVLEGTIGEKVSQSDFDEMSETAATAITVLNEKLDDIPMVSITYSKLLELRNAGKLVKGLQYRITDYKCTTTQENTKAASHNFDIIVIADSTSVLNENARACQHDGDTYFNTSKLNAWELKYTIDNDSNRFAWADTANGKGVIYWMKDEWNNECPYDFKNIMFVRKLNNGVYDEANGTEEYVYTFNCYDENNSTMMDTSIFGNDGTLTDMDENICGVHDNVIKSYYADNKHNYYILNNNVFISLNNSCDGFYNNTFGNCCYSNTFSEGCKYNTFGNNCHNNTFEYYCSFNNLCDDCYNNTFGINCTKNTFGNACYGNTFKNACYRNTFENDCSNNIFGNNCSNNTFGKSCHNNTFENDCSNNIFGKYCSNNTFGKNCYYNTLGNKCFFNTFGNATAIKSYMQHITLDSGVSYTYIDCSATTSSTSYCQNIQINAGICGTYSSRKTITIPTAGQTFKTTIASANDTTITV